jgi:basic membrane protein A
LTSTSLPHSGPSRRNLLRFGAFGALAAGGAAFLSACSSSSSAAGSGSASAGSAKALKVGLVLTGAINDKSFNQVAYEGLQEAIKAVGGTMDYSENVSDTDASQVLTDYASRGYDVVIAHSFSYQEPTADVAANFPKVTFMVATGTNLADNIGTYQNPDYQGAYLAGILAAGASKSGVLGWVGTLPSPNLLANYHAFEAGAQRITPSIKVLHAMVGSYYDPAKTKEATLAQIQQGADVIEEQSTGVLDAAKAQNVLAIGALVDENALAPQTVLTSVTWVLGPVYTVILKSVQDSSWTSKDWSYGVAQGSVGLADFHGLESKVSAAALAEQKKVLADIKSGSFEVPRKTDAL